jgi:arylsulfatase A-like enzyme
MLGHEAIAVALTFDEVAEGSGSGDLFARYQRSFHPDRAGDIMYDGPENHLLTSSPTQTSHGSPYNYDSHVPMIFAGPGIAAGLHDGHVQTVDLAATLAAILGISAPGDLDGQVLPVVR